MGRVRVDITMSLDGFVAAPAVGLDAPLGIGGERLHDWLFQGARDPGGPDRFVADEFFTLTGAPISGGAPLTLVRAPGVRTAPSGGRASCSPIAHGRS